MPANTAVAAPITAINVIATGERTINGLNRTNKNGPAFTMVAAWINADTGVGASIAPGNHT